MQINDDIEYCVHTLKKGGLILYPTDTVWGIGCDATNKAAVEKIYTLKKRDRAKGLIILLSSEKDIPQYTLQKNVQVYDYIKGIGKPTTAIYSNAKNLASNLMHADGSIGIRVVRDKFCKEMIEKFGRPVVSTSSNISGFPAPRIFSDIDIAIKEQMDYVVTYRQEEQVPGKPSTVVRINSDGTFILVRP
jgi:L-threonylcarbamoyladenylate synthase